ncbi:MAG: S-layer homology domain-containing protein [Trueperaceae bacterium]|nr:S-layer homology domain-containing protein [Trueperaceae bacterium]
MKKLLITILAAVLASGAFAQQSFPDVPEGHWAANAVADIADLNIVIGFPDGTFRGNEAFTRYQAALVISRLLGVINDNIDAAQAMTQEDLESLRNAVQELSSDLAAQDVRLSSAESAIAGLSDDVGANQARIDELASLIEDLQAREPQVDPEVLNDLQNQLASLRVAVDTAQATADQALERADAASGRADEAAAAAADAHTRANEAYGRAGRALRSADNAQETADEALSRANAAGSAAGDNASEIAALNDLVQRLRDQIAALEGMDVGPDQSLLDRVAANESDIANIREFVILLRRDQVALRDRVSALEASDEQQSADIADLQERVTALEDNPLQISGTIELDYFVGRPGGDGQEFDIDRAFGVGFERSMGQSTFSSGTDEEANTAGDDDEVDEPNEYAEDRADISYGSDFDASLTINLGAGSVFDGEGSPRGLNSFEAVVELSVDETDIPIFEDDDGNLTVSGYTFRVDSFTSTFDPIGAEPITFAFGDEVTGFTTPYTLNREDVGFTASVGAPDFLAFLDPSVHVAYLTNDYDDGAPGFVATGGRLSVSPLDGVTLGGTYVRNADNTADYADELGDNLNDTIFGVDGQVALGPVSIAAEYANADANNGGYQDEVLFATADASFDILGGVEFGANYRDIAMGWEQNVGTGVDAPGEPQLTDADDYPFAEDQVGFGVNAGLGLFIFDVNAFFDTYEVNAGDEVTAFGADASAELFRGFSLTGFYEQVSVNGTAADDNHDQFTLDRDTEYDTGFGVGLVHDGAADNALISNLNLEFAYERFEEDFSETRIFAAADYELSVSIVSLTPYVSFESEQDDDANTDDTQEIKVGTGLSTEPLDVYLRPSLDAAVNYRTNEHTDMAVYTAEQLQWSVGLNLNEFLLPYSSLSARYGSYSGTNIDDSLLGTDAATDISEGDENNGLTSTVSGFEVEWDYYDLVFSYGIFDHDPDTSVGNDASTAQAFGVSYTVAF